MAEMKSIFAAAGWAENYARQSEDGLGWEWLIVVGCVAIMFMLAVALIIAWIRRLSRLPAK
jgi:hypothetical protein